MVQALAGTLVSALLFVNMFFGQPTGNGNFITFGWALGLLMLSLVLPILLRICLMRWSMRVMARMHQLLPVSNATGGYYQQYIEAEGAGKDLRIYRQKDEILALLHQALTAWFGPMNRMNSLVSGLTAAANAVISGFAYLLIGLRALAGMYSIGQVTQYVGAITSFSSNITALISTLASAWENAAYLPMLFEFLDLPDRKDQGTQPIPDGLQVHEIEFCDVSFRYPESEQWVLRHLSFKIQAGERIAVVGRNGSGKTTMIKLLCRLYDPTEGHITLSGVDIRQYSSSEYFSLLTVVFQDFMLPSLQLGQVIATSAQCDEDRARSALDRVGFSLEHKTAPLSLHTYINRDYSEEGIQFSGGEMQKIALARALYKDAPLVVLDEPTGFPPAASAMKSWCWTRARLFRGAAMKSC